jgi:hypothetical protein
MNTWFNHSAYHVEKNNRVGKYTFHHLNILYQRYIQSSLGILRNWFQEHPQISKSMMIKCLMQNGTVFVSSLCTSYCILKTIFRLLIIPHKVWMLSQQHCYTQLFRGWCLYMFNADAILSSCDGLNPQMRNPWMQNVDCLQLMIKTENIFQSKSLCLCYLIVHAL